MGGFAYGAGSIGVFLAMATRMRRADLGDGIARDDGVEVIVFGEFLDVEVVDEVVLLGLVAAEDAAYDGSGAGWGFGGGFG